MNLKDLAESTADFLKEFYPKLLLAIIVLIVGHIIINVLASSFKRFLNRKNVDISLGHFLTHFVKWTLRIGLFLSVANLIGIKTTSFLALLGSAGLAIGLALQGSLANFAGGVIILLLRPFKVGDFIGFSGNTGTVKHINIFHTVLFEPDNKMILVPNGALANSTIINFTANSTRRADLTIGISYDDNPKVAKQALTELIEKEPRILKDPAPYLGVAALGDSSVNILVRFWTSSSDYMATQHDFLESVKEYFDEKGISIPYPHREYIIRNKS